MIEKNQTVPNATLYEFIAEETPGCALGPNPFQVSDMVKDKKKSSFLDCLEHLHQLAQPNTSRAT